MMCFCGDFKINKLLKEIVVTENAQKISIIRIKHNRVRIKSVTGVNSDIST